MHLLLFVFSLNVHLVGSFEINPLRRDYKIKLDKSTSTKKAQNIEDSWYFIHFNEYPDFSFLLKNGINIKSQNMINKHWYSLFLTPQQSRFLSKYALLRPVSQTEKIINFQLIPYSESLQIETSSTFDVANDLKSFNGCNDLFVHKRNDHLFQLFCSDNQNLAQYLSFNSKVYSISPKNSTIFSNNRAVGYTQFNTQNAKLSGKSKDIITIDRTLETKGLTGEGQSVLVLDVYLDPNSTFFYDPKHPLFEKNQYNQDHRKILVIHDDYSYKPLKVNEHGTHAAGCLLGSSHLSPDESDIHLYNGAAPNAKIAFYQCGSSGLYKSGVVEEMVAKVHPSVCSNSWGYRVLDIGDENEWNMNAKNLSDTLFVFSAGNFGGTNNKNLDYYETLTSPSTAKNVLTVGALSSVPVNDKSDAGEPIVKSIYLVQSMTQETYKTKVKSWSLNEASNPGLDLLFKEGSVEFSLTKDVNDNFDKKNLMLIVDDKNGFDAIKKENPPLVLLTKADFDVDNFESLGFSHLFPVLVLDGGIVDALYNSYGHIVDVETNFVSSNTTSIHRATFSSKGPSELGVIKPEIVAPGTSIASARSDPNGVPGHADIIIYDGTSASAPNAAGAATLVAQYFTDKKYRSSLSVKPSSSLLRSFLINAADPLDSAKPYPNADVGFGALNLGEYVLTSVSSSGNDEHVLVGDRIEILGDQHLVAEVDIKENSRDLRITMSYLDEFFNDDSSVALGIDLDLVVISPDKTVYRGNQRVDNTEEMFSTNERVIIKKEELKPGKYEIHVISHIPEIVTEKSVMFSVTVFGPISDTAKEMITFSKAKECIPVVDGHGKCNKETTLNECIFDDMEAYTGHSCQNEAVVIIDSSKKLFELEPFGTKYVNMFYPLDGEFANLSITITSATDFLPKYAYTKSAKGVKMPMREIDADDIIAGSDLSMTIYNHGQAPEWQAESCLLTLVYNKSPKKTTFIINFQVALENDAPQPQPPTSTPSDSCDCKDSNVYFLPLIVAFVGCVVLFICVVILAVMNFKASAKSIEKSEYVSDKQLKSPLI
ncbi:hypothetical protein M9Y10_010274 [Tritrichomonas musculus]|uniref:Peptidase S8/S53 domain-containing protein n=1 Tax=Tritrichomonas musculus TaxID=1915356 RepID=A0ABR2IM40_9EUKA